MAENSKTLFDLCFGVSLDCELFVVSCSDEFLSEEIENGNVDLDSIPGAETPQAPGFYVAAMVKTTSPDENDPDDELVEYTIEQINAVPATPATTRVSAGPIAPLPDVSAGVVKASGTRSPEDQYEIDSLRSRLRQAEELLAAKG
jgi:hypothetical protein